MNTELDLSYPREPLRLSFGGEPIGKSPGGDGGDIRFIPGKGAVESEEFGPGKHGSILFLSADQSTELMKITSYGEFFVNGKKVVDDIEAYRGFLSWLRTNAQVRPYIDECLLVKGSK